MRCYDCVFCVYKCEWDEQEHSPDDAETDRVCTAVIKEASRGIDCTRDDRSPGKIIDEAAAIIRDLSVMRRGDPDEESRLITAAELWLKKYEGDE